MSNLFKPTDEQESIINPKTWGSCLIIAKAGSGKTTTIIHRAIKQSEIIESWQSIAIISFTNKSSEDIKNKVESYNIKSVITSTFHSFLLQNVLIFSKLFKGKEISFDYSKKVHSLSQWIQVVSNEYIIPVASNTSNDYLFEYAIKLLKENSYILKYLKIKFLAIYIDEAQDNNQLQYEIIDILLSKGIQIVLVGDPDQTIYQFRGANADKFNSLKAHVNFKNNTYKLTRNFRCHELINDCAISYTVPYDHIYECVAGRYYGVFITNNNINDIKQVFEDEKYADESVCFLFRSIKNNKQWLEQNNIPIIEYPTIIQKQSTQSAIAILDSLFEVYYGDSYLEVDFIDRFLPSLRSNQASTLIRSFKHKPSRESFGALNQHWSIFNQEYYDVIVDEMLLDSTKRYYSMSSNKFIAMTIHSAKGLEFDNVIVQAQDFRNMKQQSTKELFYVACTRAKNTLIFM